jgi:hypothetical protein
MKMGMESSVYVGPVVRAPHVMSGAPTVTKQGKSPVDEQAEPPQFSKYPHWDELITSRQTESGDLFWLPSQGKLGSTLGHTGASSTKQLTPYAIAESLVAFNAKYGPYLAVAEKELGVTLELEYCVVDFS